MDDPVSVPLGFWLRTVDSLFETSMDEMFTSEGRTRRLWQVLNTLKRNEPATRRGVDQAIAMFLDNGPTDSTSLLDDLAGRGWVSASDDAGTLTDAGRSAPVGMEEKVARHREAMFQDISDATYRTTVETLARITTNLDPQGEPHAKIPVIQRSVLADDGGASRAGKPISQRVPRNDPLRAPDSDTKIRNPVVGRDVFGGEEAAVAVVFHLDGDVVVEEPEGAEWQVTEQGGGIVVHEQGDAFAGTRTVRVSPGDLEE